MTLDENYIAAKSPSQATWSGTDIVLIKDGEPDAPYDSEVITTTNAVLALR